MMEAKKSTKDFYSNIGTKGLSGLVDKKQTDAYLKFLNQYLLKDKKILDLCCGYGRLTIPLAKRGFDVEGIDIACNLINDAKNIARKANLKVRFKVGDMCNLPYGKSSFDFAICMWSSFNHLLTQKDQIEALEGAYRILKVGGLGIIDFPYYRDKTKNLLKYGKFLKNKSHLFSRTICGYQTVLYMHNKSSILNILKKAKFIKYKIKCENIFHRRRQFLYLFK